MDSTQFQQTISQSENPVVVDFWAPWCGPCRLTKPVLENLAQAYRHKVDFVPINADEAPQILQTYNVFGIPTVLAFRDGEVVGRLTGAKSESDYKTVFDGLTSGEDFNLPISNFDRGLRLGAGALFIVIGLFTSSWLLTGVGGVVAFLGIYDRCPVWAAVKGFLQGLGQAK